MALMSPIKDESTFLDHQGRHSITMDVHNTPLVSDDARDDRTNHVNTLRDCDWDILAHA
jgi:hypothetical protein